MKAKDDDGVWRNIRRARRNECCDYCGFPFYHLEVDGEPADLVTETELGVFCGRACYQEQSKINRPLLINELGISEDDMADMAELEGEEGEL